MSKKLEMVESQENNAMCCLFHQLLSYYRWMVGYSMLMSMANLTAIRVRRPRLL